MKREEVIKLNKATSQTVSGPKIVYQDNLLVLEYDYENDDGTVEWTRIVFGEVISYEWRDNSCIDEDDIVNFSQIRCQNKSDFLDSKISLWQQRYGWQEFQKDKGGKKRFKHFTIYFDDVGSLNVVASECRVES